jgi:hypothetical protein
MAAEGKTRRFAALGAPATRRRELAGSDATLSFHRHLRGLRCDAKIFVLMEDGVLRVLVIVLVPEDADSAVLGRSRRDNRR